MMNAQATKDPPWLREFVKLHPLLLRQAWRLVGQEAEDVVQNAYLRACEKKPRDPSAFRRWMTRIVVRTALNRKRQKVPVVFSSLKADGSSNQGLEYKVKAPSETPLWKRMDRKEVLKAVQEAMRSVLNGVEREALALKMNGATYQEIAMSLDVSLEDVATMLRQSLYIIAPSHEEAGSAEARTNT